MGGPGFNSTALLNPNVIEFHRKVSKHIKVMVQASDFHAPTPPSMSPLLESKNLGQGTYVPLEMAGKGDQSIYVGVGT